MFFWGLVLGAKLSQDSESNIPVSPRPTVTKLRASERNVRPHGSRAQRRLPAARTGVPRRAARRGGIWTVGCGPGAALGTASAWLFRTWWCWYDSSVLRGTSRWPAEAVPFLFKSAPGAPRRQRVRPALSFGLVWDARTAATMGAARRGRTGALQAVHRTAGAGGWVDAGAPGRADAGALAPGRRAPARGGDAAGSGRATGGLGRRAERRQAPPCMILLRGCMVLGRLFARPGGVFSGLQAARRPAGPFPARGARQTRRTRHARRPGPRPVRLRGGQAPARTA